MIGIYVRISTEEQSRFSINDQLRECRAKAGMSEVKEYVDDGYSGEFLDRPALTQLREDVREGLISGIVCLDPDRLARKLMLQLLITDEFDKRGVEIVFVNGEYAKTPEGQLFYSMRGAIAEFEKAKINERMSRGRREKARQGRVLRDFQIYGYIYNKDEEQLEINEHEAVIVRLIFDLCTKPRLFEKDGTKIEGFNGIAHFLMDKEIPTKRGGSVWHRQVVKQILMNPTYIGDFYQNKWNTEGMLGNKYRDPGERIPMKLRPEEEWIHIPCPPIIEIEQFEYAQKILNESKRRWKKKTINKYLLSGIIRCGICDNTMSGVKSRNWGKDVFIYTCSKNTAGAKNKGCGRRPQCHTIDNQVWETVHAWLNQPDEIAAASEFEKPSLSFEESEIERMRTEIEKARNARKRLLRLFADDTNDFGEDEIRQELRDWKEKEDRLNKRLKDLQEQLERSQTNTYSRHIMQEAVDYYLTKNPDDLTFDDKQQLIRQVVREVRVYKDRIEVRTF